MTEAEQSTPVPGIPCWVSLMTRDLRAAEDFYGTVLGWAFRSGTLGEGFSVAHVDALPVAGIGQITPGLPTVVSWTPYFAVPDVDTAAAGSGNGAGPSPSARSGSGRGGGPWSPIGKGRTFGFEDTMSNVVRPVRTLSSSRFQPRSMENARFRLGQQVESGQGAQQAQRGLWVGAEGFGERVGAQGARPDRSKRSNRTAAPSAWVVIRPSTNQATAPRACNPSPVPRCCGAPGPDRRSCFAPPC
ncbi:hypothetical protein SBADM41S_06510 [Streptomyces badius]